MGLQIFRDTIARHPQVKDRLRNLLLENVQKERLGQLIDRSLMKSTLGMLVDLGIEGTAVYEVRRGPAQVGTEGRGAGGPRASTDRVICWWGIMAWVTGGFRGRLPGDHEAVLSRGVSRLHLQEHMPGLHEEGECDGTGPSGFWPLRRHDLLAIMFNL